DVFYPLHSLEQALTASLSGLSRRTGWSIGTIGMEFGICTMDYGRAVIHCARCCKWTTHCAEAQ
ncbi:hypothetical protein, partial [Muriicola sp.]|uniref:hypothetical protein n=1 Tax=Muriicola sp. TaxID=2020856 RepID=UPI003569D59C